jgi:hypothetical protein
MWDIACILRKILLLLPSFLGTKVVSLKEMTSTVKNEALRVVIPKTACLCVSGFEMYLRPLVNFSLQVKDFFGQRQLGIPW